MQKLIWIVFIFGLLTCLSCETIFKGGDQPMQETLSTIKKDSKIGNDANYDSLLLGHKHLTVLDAPPVFRKLLTDLQPIRFELSFGIESRSNSLVLLWYCGEFGATGTVEAVLAKITESLTTGGFSADPEKTNAHGYPEHRFSHTQGRYQHELVLVGPERFVGTKEPRAGGSLTYVITIPGETALLNYTKVLSVFPGLRCEVLDTGFETLFEGLPLSHVAFGGTWERYYNWTYVFRFQDKQAADEFTQAVEQKLRRDDFLLESARLDTRTFMRNRGKEPVIYVERKSELEASVRFQPHM